MHHFALLLVEAGRVGKKQSERSDKKRLPSPHYPLRILGHS